MADQAEKCGNCKFFLQLDVATGKGVCRFDPPQAADDRNESPVMDNGNGRRWPVCWSCEWCGKWLKRT